MAVADGKRVAVYDVTVADWDQPVIDLAAGQLRERFEPELCCRMGARSRCQTACVRGGWVRDDGGLRGLLRLFRAAALGELAHHAGQSCLGVVLDDIEVRLQERIERLPEHRDDATQLLDEREGLEAVVVLSDEDRDEDEARTEPGTRRQHIPKGLPRDACDGDDGDEDGQQCDERHEDDRGEKDLVPLSIQL